MKNLKDLIENQEHDIKTLERQIKSMLVGLQERCQEIQCRIDRGSMLNSLGEIQSAAPMIDVYISKLETMKGNLEQLKKVAAHE